MSKSPHARLLLLDAIVSIVICVACFPDIVLLGASFRPSEIAMGHLPQTDVRALLPGMPWRQVHHGFNDIGTSVWGLEPGQLFVARAIHEGQSIFWNPYAAAGSLGVESLTDSKLAPFSILAALLGPSSLAFHLSYFAVLVLSLTMLARLLRLHFDVGRLGCTVAGVVFVLNGAHLSNITNVVVQPYLFGPVLLGALLDLIDRATLPRAVVCVLGHIGVLAPLFLATSLLVFGSVYAVAIVYAASRRAGAAWLVWAIGSGLWGCMILLPILVPTFWSLTYLDTFTEYNQRVLIPTNGLAFLSVFTPRHFWDSYGSFYDSGPPAGILWQEASWVHHLGIATAVAAMQAFSGPITRRNWPVLAVAALVVLGVGRAFNHFPFSVFSSLPVLRGIQPGYWNCLTGLFGAMLAGIGISEVKRRGAQLLPLFAATLMIAVAGGVLLKTFGWPSSLPKQLSLLFAGAVLLLANLALLLARKPRWRQYAATGLALLIAVELISYVNTLRPRRITAGKDLAARIPSLDRLRSPVRTLSVGRDVLPPEWGAHYGIHQADGFRESVLPWYREFFVAAFGRPLQQLSFGATAQEVPSIDLPRASYLGVRYFIVGQWMVPALERLRALKLPEVYADDRVVLIENTAARPRAQLFSALGEGRLPIGADSSLIEKMAFSDDPRLIADARSLGIGNQPGTRPEASAAVVIDGHAEVTIEARLPQPMVLSLADTWHPRWRVFIDGVPGHTGRLNDAFRGVALPAGVHRVTFRYQPLGFPFTGVVSLLGTLALLASLFPFRFRNR